MDVLEQLVSECEVCAVVIGNGQSFVLIPLGEDALPDPSLRLAGYEFVGCFGHCNGRVRVACEQVTQDAVDTMKAACPAWARYVTAKLKSAGDSVAWLENLYRLEDNRDPQN